MSHYSRGDSSSCRRSSTGFTDVHVHFVGNRGIDDVVSAGIIAVRNAGMRSNAETVSRCRERFQKPAIITSCWAICKKGGYGDRFGIAVDTRDEIKAEIRRLKKAGADIIKVMASGIVSLKRPGTLTRGGFNPDELRLIVEEAAPLGLRVMAHANGDVVIAAAEAGVRSIEHGFFVTERALDMLAEKSIYWVPTIGALVRAADKEEEKNEYLGGLVEQHLRMLRRAWSIGVPLALGTDCVLPDPDYTQAYNAELSYFEQAGIPRDEVMKIACEGGAKLLGIAGENHRQ